MSEVEMDRIIFESDINQAINLLGVEEVLNIIENICRKRKITINKYSAERFYTFLKNREDNNDNARDKEVWMRRRDETYDIIIWKIYRDAL